ncbi:hypothetical protein ACVWZX_004446 [Deinococcus sp. UYEF24]
MNVSEKGRTRAGLGMSLFINVAWLCVGES